MPQILGKSPPETFSRVATVHQLTTGRNVFELYNWEEKVENVPFYVCLLIYLEWQKHQILYHFAMSITYLCFESNVWCFALNIHVSS